MALLMWRLLPFLLAGIVGSLTVLVHTFVIFVVFRSFFNMVTKACLLLSVALKYCKVSWSHSLYTVFNLAQLSDDFDGQKRKKTENGPTFFRCCHDGVACLTVKSIVTVAGKLNNEFRTVESWAD